MDSVIKAAIIYLFLWLVIRLTGRRAVGQLTIFEFILLLIIGGATQRALTGEDYSLTNAFLIVITLMTMNVAMSLLEIRFARFGQISKGLPLVLVEHGRPMPRRMVRARVTEGEIMESARRHHGLERMAEIKFAILETSGVISIVPQAAPASHARKRPAREREPQRKE